MKDIYVDVELKLDAEALLAKRDPARLAMELSRDEARRLCDQSGAELRTDRHPEVVIGGAMDPKTGRHLLLVAARWAVIAPDDTETHREPDAVAGA